MFERYPWAVLDSRKVEQLPLSLPLEGEWEVTGGYKGRMPGPFEADLYVAIHSLWNEAGRPASGELRVRTGDLLRLMGKGDGGKQYELLTDALARLRSVNIRTRLVLENGRKRDVGFGLLDGHDVTQDGWTVLRLSPTLCATLATQGRALNTKQYFALQRPASRRLYRYLDHRRYRGPTAVDEVEFPLSEVAGELPVTQRAPSHVKRVLDAAHEELIGAGFLRAAHYLRRGRAWFVAYRFGLGEGAAPAVPTRVPGFADRVELAMRTLAEPQHAAFYAQALTELGDAQFDHLLGSIREQIRDGLALDLARKFFAAGVRSRAGWQPKDPARPLLAK